MSPAARADRMWRGAAETWLHEPAGSPPLPPRGATTNLPPRCGPRRCGVPQPYQAPRQLYQAPRQLYQAPRQLYQAPRQPWQLPRRRRPGTGGTGSAPAVRTGRCGPARSPRRTAGVFAVISPAAVSLAAAGPAVTSPAVISPAAACPTAAGPVATSPGPAVPPAPRGMPARRIRQAGTSLPRAGWSAASAGVRTARARQYSASH